MMRRGKPHEIANFMYKYTCADRTPREDDLKCTRTHPHMNATHKRMNTRMHARA